MNNSQNSFFSNIFGFSGLRKAVQEDTIPTFFAYLGGAVFVLSHFAIVAKNFEAGTPTGVGVYYAVLAMFGFLVMLFSAHVGFKLSRKTFSLKTFSLVVFALWWREMILQIVLISVPLVVSEIINRGFTFGVPDQLSADMMLAYPFIMGLTAILIPLVILRTYSKD